MITTELLERYTAACESDIALVAGPNRQDLIRDVNDLLIALDNNAETLGMMTESVRTEIEAGTLGSPHVNTTLEATMTTLTIAKEPENVRVVRRALANHFTQSGRAALLGEVRKHYAEKIADGC